MSNLQNFVKSKGRAASPQTGHPEQLTRRQQVGANARVRIKKTTLSHDDHAPLQLRGLGQNVARYNQPVVQPQHQQPQLPRQAQGHATQPEHDAYDTDAASIDTTQPRGSFIQVADSQRTVQKQQYDDDDGSDDNESEYDESDEDGEGGEDGEHNQYGYDGERQEHVIGGTRRDDDAGRADLSEGNDSYPTTTSGVPDNFFDQEYGHGQELSSDEIIDENMISPSPQRAPVTINPHSKQHVGLLQRPASAARAPMPATNQPQLYGKAAHIRGSNRPTETPIPMRESAPVIPSSMPPTYSQANARHNPVQPHAGEETLPPQVARTQSGSSHGQAAKPYESKRSRSVNGAVAEAVPRGAPVPHLSEEENNRAPAEPIEDYDKATLLSMKFEELKNQDFDSLPRPNPPVLSEDMQQKPLAERLEHVQKSLDNHDQRKFLASLSTDEWENAGDWFIDQFSSIIKRTKEARQNKRKHAVAFEEEVSKRHENVAKRQCAVKDALSEMQTRGQGLILKSPRKV